MIRPSPVLSAARVVLIAGIVAGATVAPGQTAAPAIATPTPADATRLGEVRGDTLIVSLERLVDAALERNEMLLASGAWVDAARAQATGAWSGFLPRVSVSEFFLRSDDPLMAFGFKLNNRNVQAADFAPDRLNDPGETDSWVTRLQLLQPIFNGGMEWNGKAAANAASRAAVFDHARARETTVLQAVEAYEGLALALSYRGVVEAAIVSAEAHERQARSLLEAEMATEADLLQARVFLSRLRQQRIIVTNQVAAAGEAIRLLTAIETPLALAAEPGPVRSDPGDLPAAGDVRQRSDLEARRFEAVAAGKLVGVATGAMLPHVNLSLQRDYYSQSDIFGSDAKSWGLGVYATWDLFKGLQDIGDLRRARAQGRAAEHRYQFELRRAQHEAHQAWRDAAAARDRIAVAEDAVEAARASLRIVANQYREGLASMVDLLDVQTAATQAEGDLVQARHDYRVDLARLAHAAGSGIPEGGIQ
ncbi:MAG TPA: TolC family protein [Candidatus Krumholzibacteria bacterium]|nr:TolC family protein [Candidatus Krumholzibacteria bacterium]HPD70608.1 TolC family protein [Candidatus Krumholzibacteria bacterium]HRY39692.1 TolC family protein [Candidatus Krumholzibacteria bacterium]